MTLKQWQKRIDMLRDLRAKFDGADIKEDLQVTLTSSERILLCEICATEAMRLDRSHFVVKES